jgi:hypothetical protein
VSEDINATWTDGPVTIDGSDYAFGITVYNGYSLDDPSCTYQREYALSGKYTRLLGTAGFADDTPDTTPTSFAVIADDDAILSEAIRLREPIQIDLDVSGVVRLGIVVDDNCEGTAVALGDPRLDRA